MPIVLQSFLLILMKFCLLMGLVRGIQYSLNFIGLRFKVENLVCMILFIKKIKINVGLRWDIYVLILFKHGMVIDTSEVFFFLLNTGFNYLNH